MDEEKKNVFSLVKDGKKKDKNPIINLKISYSDGIVEQESCNWFGESVEIPGLFIFGMDGAEVPEALINLEHVRRIDVSKD